jgi:3-oxoacyl-[acyl-carrier protein] reductase
MDLGIAGKKALVCASSEGLGKACAVSLSREGVHVYINGRTQETLEATADEILINNNAGPNPVGFAQSSQKDWDEAIAANMMAPIFMIQAVLPGMRERKFGRIINITSAMVKSPSPIMCVSSAARAGVTALSKAVSKEAVMDNVTIKITRNSSCNLPV